MLYFCSVNLCLKQTAMNRVIFKCDRETQSMEVLQYGSEKNQQPAKKRPGRRAWPIIIGVILSLAAIAAAVYLFLYKDIHFQYRIELGDPVPSAEVFAKAQDVSVRYITDVSQISESEAASHWVSILANGDERLVRLVIEDATPPTAQPAEMMIAINQEISPDQMVTDIEDAGLVKIQWQQAPQFGVAGDYPVVIKLQDLSGNTSLVSSVLSIRAVVDTLTIEAGSDAPALSDFLADAALKGAFVTDMDALTLGIPGEYEVSISVDDIVYKSMLVAEDTVAPKITAQLVYITPGNQAQPEDFITEAIDATALSFEFAAEPDYGKIGFQDVTVTARDLGGNSVQETAALLISNAAPITLEIRGDALTADDFSGLSAYSDIAIANEMVPNALGYFEVVLLLDGEANPTRVTVIDTTSPTAEPVPVFWYVNHALSADRFVQNAFDYTDISYAFANEPDWSLVGTQNVTVVLTDTSGNSAEFSTTLMLDFDTEPPKLYGVKDRYCYIGQPVAYFAEVFAVDNCDEEVTIEVNNSGVNIHQAGEYTVTYTATDSSGNSTQLSCKFTFVEETVSDEELDAVVQSVFSSILTDDMSLGQKAHAVFKYVNRHVKYSGGSNKADWKYEAYRGITTGRGDCFTYFATAKYLLEEIGAQTISVERSGGNKTTRHYWLLVNLGSGWYHFDAISVGPVDYDCFMRTDKEILSRGRNFWSFDRSLYPPTPETPFILE